MNFQGVFWHTVILSSRVYLSVSHSLIIIHLSRTCSLHRTANRQHWPERWRWCPGRCPRWRHYYRTYSEVKRQWKCSKEFESTSSWTEVSEHSPDSSNACDTTDTWDSAGPNFSSCEFGGASHLCVHVTNWRELCGLTTALSNPSWRSA